MQKIKKIAKFLFLFILSLSTSCYFFMNILDGDLIKFESFNTLALEEEKALLCGDCQIQLGSGHQRGAAAKAQRAGKAISDAAGGRVP